MLRIGITGGIGSGKSTVAELFQELGIAVIDADALARAVVQIGQPGYRAVLEAFGDAILDPQQDIDRAKLRQQVFQDDAARARLEAIIHPLVRQAMQQQLQHLHGPYCLLMIPLLFETGQQDLVDRVLVVDTDEAAQIQRVRARSGLEPEQIQNIIAAQLPAAQRRRLAHDVLVNNRDIPYLRRQVQALHQRYLTLAAEQAQSETDNASTTPRH